MEKELKKVYNIEDDSNKYSTKNKLLVAFVLVFSLCVFIYGAFKSGVLNYENGKISYNENKIHFYGMAKQIKNLENKNSSNSN